MVSLSLPVATRKLVVSTVDALVEFSIDRFSVGLPSYRIVTIGLGIAFRRVHEMSRLLLAVVTCALAPLVRGTGDYR